MHCRVGLRKEAHPVLYWNGVDMATSHGDNSRMNRWNRVAGKKAAHIRVCTT